ncbi:MAG TPA: hypothetical protein DCM21_11475 [Butyrivibrio sp.]|nr:hypothetical protein [Butyrivibrio sp.]
MGFGYRYKPSKTKIREYAEKMDRIDDFCSKNNISRSANSDSYYFEINGQKYRVSNHSVESSNRGAYEEGTHEQIRELYHPEGREKDTIYIHAGKTRIMEIYEKLKAGKELDGRGNVKERDEYER